jgi:hypothetical protein
MPICAQVLDATLIQARAAAALHAVYELLQLVALLTWCPS